MSKKKRKKKQEAFGSQPAPEGALDQAPAIEDEESLSPSQEEAPDADSDDESSPDQIDEGETIEGDEQPIETTADESITVTDAEAAPENGDEPRSSDTDRATIAAKFARAKAKPKGSKTEDAGIDQHAANDAHRLRAIRESEEGRPVKMKELVDTGPVPALRSAPDWAENYLGDDAGNLEDGDESSGLADKGRAPSDFTSKKQPKEKRAWKDLAGKEKQTPSQVKSKTSPSEEEESSDTADDTSSSKSPGRLRKMMEAEAPEPDLENGDDESEDKFSAVSRLGRRQDLEPGESEEDPAAKHAAFMWYYNNGNELYHDGRFEEAEAEYLSALGLLEYLADPVIEQEFVILENLGDIYIFLDKPDLAVELYERTHEERFASRVPDTKFISALIKNGSKLATGNRFEEAEQQYRKAAGIAVGVFEKDDPIMLRITEACLELARHRSTLQSRFSTVESDRIRDLLKQDADIAIIHRKKKPTGADAPVPLDIWKAGRRIEGEPEKPSSKGVWLAASGTLLVLFAFAYALLVPHSGVPGITAGGAFDEAAGTYSSADGLKVFDLAKGGRATYSYKGDSKKATYRFVGSDYQDLLPLLPGHLRTDFKFLRSDESAIIDPDGTHLYPHEGAEQQLVKQMWRYADIAQGYRHEKTFYPETDEAWTISKEKLTFTNPVTGKLDKATITSTTGDALDRPLRDSVAQGKPFAEQPEPAPGRIICNTYNGRLFFIRAFDRNSKLLTASDKGKCFFIELADGDNMTKEKLAKLQHEEKLATPTAKSDNKLCFLFTRNPDAETNFSFLKSAIPAALLGLAIIALAVRRHRVNRKNAGPVSLAFCCLTIFLLLCWYVVGLLDIR